MLFHIGYFSLYYLYMLVDIEDLKRWLFHVGYYGTIFNIIDG